MTTHTAPNPFPRILADRGIVITDERCRCGALRSEHADTFAFGHGACALTHCEQFTWVAMVETALTTRTRRPRRSEVPALDHDAMMAARFGHKLDARMRRERLLTWRLFEHLAARGFVVTAVNDGDEVVAVDSPKAAMELIFNLDESRVIFGGRKLRDRRHAVLIILGNGSGGEDLISDWSYTNGDPDDFDAAMAKFTEHIEEVR